MTIVSRKQVLLKRTLSRLQHNKTQRRISNDAKSALPYNILKRLSKQYRTCVTCRRSVAYIVTAHFVCTFFGVPMHTVKRFFKSAAATLALLFFTASFFAAPSEPKGLAILRHSYPDGVFTATYDSALADFKIDITQKRGAENKTTTLYWADGKMLPAGKLAERESYWPLLYPYTKEVPDPAKFTEEDVRRLRNFSSAENRAKQAGTSPYFFNALYDCETRQSTEAHIKRVSFLGKYTNAHERIFAPLERIAFVPQLRHCHRCAAAGLGTKKYLLGMAARYRSRRMDDAAARKTLDAACRRNRSVRIGRIYLGRQVAHLGQYAFRISSRVDRTQPERIEEALKK